jgi:preprotein translocase subunit SecB
MLPSKIQLHELLYFTFNISARENDSKDRETVPFDFNGVNVGESASLNVIDENKEDPKQFALKLRIVIENKEGKPAPYNVEVEVAGLFLVNPIMPVEERAEFVLINGSSVIYGAIREEVLGLTSRGVNGPLMLPTVTFLDYKDKLNKRAQ